MHTLDYPGALRKESVFITGSSHRLPEPELLNDLLLDMITHVHEIWDETDPCTLAAYTLWKLVWIHPFDDGNGRTARALAYLVIYLKHRKLLFGCKSLTSFIQDDYAQAYIDAIRHADRTFGERKVDLNPLAEFLAEIVILKLESSP